MSSTRPPCRRFALVALLAASHALRTDAARLDEALFQFGGAAGKPPRAAAPAEVPGLPAGMGSEELLEQDQIAEEVRKRDLTIAEEFVAAIQVSGNLHLAHIREVLERFDAIRTRMLGHGATRDRGCRQAVRKILKEIREKSQDLKVLAAQKASHGQVDDGGDVPPSMRDNICTGIDRYMVSSDFREHIRFFCTTLDSVRASILAGEDVEDAVFAVAGVLSTMGTRPDYLVSGVGWGIDRVLGEERRWVFKQRRRHKGPQGALGEPSRDGADQSLASALRAWNTGVLVPPEVDTASLPSMSLKDANETVHMIRAENLVNATIAELRTSIQRLDFAKMRLATFIQPSSPSVRDRIRDVLQVIKQRTSELQSLAARREEAGEIDDSALLLPSVRNNICKNLGTYNMSEELRQEVSKVCASFDRLQKLVCEDREHEPAMFEILGRLATLKRMRGYFGTPVAAELEYMLADVWSWLGERDVFH